MSDQLQGEAIIREYTLACQARDLIRVAHARHALFVHVREIEFALAQAMQDPRPALQAARQLAAAAAVWYAVAGVDVKVAPPPRTAPEENI
jgi:hypothetical protein